jgi:hypothetical protein
MALSAGELALALSDVTEPEDLHDELVAAWESRYPTIEPDSPKFPPSLTVDRCIAICKSKVSVIRRGSIAQALIDGGWEKVATVTAPTGDAEADETNLVSSAG